MDEPGDDIIDLVIEMFQKRGARAYLGDPVSISEHMPQAANATGPFWKGW